MATEQSYDPSADQSNPPGQTVENSKSLQLGNPDMIRAYFEKIRELQQSGERYPVNLDEVWPLVYTRKGDAVKALKSSFYENEDYEVISQKAKNSSGGRPEARYQVTVPCLEHFVARKVREVFEVYRTVFNQVITQDITTLQPTTQLTRKELALLVIQSEEEKERLEQLLAIAKPKVDYVDQVLDTAECVVTTIVANELGYSAVKFNRLLKERGIQWKVDGVWVLTQKYAGRGYAQMRTHVHVDTKGEKHTTMLMVWTQRGRAMLHYIFRQQGKQQSLPETNQRPP